MSEPTPPTNQKYKFRLLPLDPKSPDDMLQAAQLAEAAFDSENSLFQRTYLVDPYPSPEERKKGTVKRLTYGLGKGKVAFKAVVDDPDNETGKDGDMAGFSIWQPPGTGYRVFESTDREKLTDEEKEVYEQVDLDGWNTLFGNMQKSRERLHGGKDHWYLEVLAIHPTYQRQGLGNTLLSTQLSSLPADQAVQLESTPAGQGLYRKFGFEVVDTLKVVGRGGKGLDIPVMVKKPSKMG